MEPFMQWGIRVILSFQSIPGLTLFMQCFTFLGNEPFYLFLMPAVYWCLDAGLGRRLAVILIASNGLNGLFKVAFHLPRPSWVDPRVKVLSLEKSYGLPSGHAMNAVAFWGFIAARLKKWWAWAIALILIILISLSRMVLGVHFPIDLLVGWILGGIFLGAYLTWEPWLISRLKRWTFAQRLGLTIGLSLGYLLLFNGILTILAYWPDPVSWERTAAFTGIAKAGGPAIHPRNPGYSAVMAGMILGLGLAFSLSDDHLKEFQTTVPWRKRSLRFVIGLGGITILAQGLKIILLYVPSAFGFIFRLIGYTLIVFWIFYLAPRLFIKVKL